MARFKFKCRRSEPIPTRRRRALPIRCPVPRPTWRSAPGTSSVDRRSGREYELFEREFLCGSQSDLGSARQLLNLGKSFANRIELSHGSDYRVAEDHGARIDAVPEK
jgi:hypothetical protein